MSLRCIGLVFLFINVSHLLPDREVTKSNPGTDKDCYVAMLPLFHATGLNAVFTYFTRGLRFVLIPTFTLHNMLKAVQDFKVQTGKSHSSCRWIHNIGVLDYYPFSCASNCGSTCQTSCWNVVWFEFIAHHHLRSRCTKQGKYSNFTKEIQLPRNTGIWYDELLS